MNKRYNQAVMKAAEDLINFHLAEEYARCREELLACALLAPLPEHNLLGILGFDGQVYPLPSLEQVSALFAHKADLVFFKMAQGFERLLLTPLAISLPVLIEKVQAALVQAGAQGGIYLTQRSPSEAFVPTRLNKEKQVWLWEQVRLVLDTDTLVYFPRQYTAQHGGLSKSEAIHDPSMCAVPGWSVALVEPSPFLPQQGEGTTLAGRPQLEIGSSPLEYLAALQAPEYVGESGKTLEDALTQFLVRLVSTRQISFDRDDGSAQWCLGQYFRLPYAQVVPTVWWARQIGRLRLDAHRTANKQCAQNWGVSTLVRL